MKSQFIRVIWGNYDHLDKKGWWHRPKIDQDALLNRINPNKMDFVVYTFGEENHKKLIDDGYISTLIDKRDIVWDMDLHQYGHKLQAWKCALEDWDEIVATDWDCVPLKPIPDNFWDKLREKHEFQASLVRYRRPKCEWRRGEERKKIPGAPFVYMRGKNIGKDVFECWERHDRPWSEEVGMAHYIDDLYGKWIGQEKYMEIHEPYWFCDHRYSRPWKENPVVEKDIVFDHLNKKERSRLIRTIQNSNSQNNND
jgi:hypothetical protein